MSKDVSLDPREVLSYLNEMGIRNVSGDMLKEFMTDLKKLIRHDMRGKVEDTSEKPVVDSAIDKALKGPERLHSCSTYSSRSKSIKNNITRRPLSCLRSSNQNVNTDNRKKSSVDIDNKQNSKQKEEKKENCICPPTKRDMVIKQKENKTRPSSANFIRVPIVENRKKSDPVSLYHYYSTLWEKYKSNLPGENNWSDIRWSVRQKTLGSKEPPVNIKTSQTSLPRRKKDWIE